MLDSVDKKILSCLKKNSRMNSSAIGAQVNMSVSAVIERIKKLETTGIIKQYTIVLDTEKMGMDVLAFIEVSTDHATQARAINAMDDFAAQHPQVVECHVVTGSSDFLLKVNTDSTKSLERLLIELKSVEGVSTTRTSIVMSTVKSTLAPFDGEEE